MTLHHRILDIDFQPHANDGALVCSCGWIGLASVFKDHRHGLGQPTVDLNAAAYDPNGSGSWRRLASIRTPRPVAERMADLCRNGHQSRWRLDSEGKRHCLDCDAARHRLHRRLMRVAAHPA